MKILFLSALSSLGLIVPALVAETPAPATLARTGSVEFHHWKQGDEPLKLIRKEEGFCALTSVTGHFQGAGEMVHVYVNDDGYWYLGGSSQQDDVAADCIVVRFSSAASSGPPAVEPVKILAASYSFGADYADVTARVRELIRGGNVFQANPGWLLADPHPYWNKALVIFCEVQGKRSIYSVGEEENVGRDLMLKDARPVTPEPARVTLGGGTLKAPVSIQLEPGLTVSGAVALSGIGDDSYGLPKYIRLVRHGKITVLNLKPMRVDPATDPKLEPGDQLQIPQGIF